MEHKELKQKLHEQAERISFLEQQVTDSGKELRKAELVRKHTAAAGLQGAACALTTFAIRNGSTDNVTCMIVQLGEKVSAKNVGDKGKVERKTVIA